jgi:hypothetical protein
MTGRQYAYHESGILPINFNPLLPQYLSPPAVSARRVKLFALDTTCLTGSLPLRLSRLRKALTFVW